MVMEEEERRRRSNSSRSLEEDLETEVWQRAGAAVVLLVTACPCCAAHRGP